MPSQWGVGLPGLVGYGRKEKLLVPSFWLWSKGLVVPFFWRVQSRILIGAPGSPCDS